VISMGYVMCLGLAHGSGNCPWENDQNEKNPPRKKVKIYPHPPR